MTIRNGWISGQGRDDRPFHFHYCRHDLWPSIGKGFIEAHDGHIWVTDAHPGAAFSFSLPIAESKEQAAPYLVN